MCISLLNALRTLRKLKRRSEKSASEPSILRFVRYFVSHLYVELHGLVLEIIVNNIEVRAGIVNNLSIIIKI